ncbi:hypothetical protein LSTR_LSTR011721 [Laodelphax striatellus]|uniref:Uncharacterized protein n=1 Tax=Laodelphax striatellus TaxID=195883 RepID=A0A482WRG4_LAOST|nr:hypothetical protein LSTR_LSTR011721 [Laodelphax striatellus]
MDNRQDSQVKGDKNFNFLKDNTFLNSGIGCSEKYSVPEKGFQPNSGKDCCPSFDGENNENGVHGTLKTVEDSDFECEKGNLMKEGEKDSLKEMDVFETNDDIEKLKKLGDNLLVEKAENKDVMQIEDGDKVENCKKEVEEREIEESGGKIDKIGENNDGKVDNVEENREGKDENALLFDENKRMEKVGTEEDVQKNLHNNEISSVDEKNEVREENMEVDGSKEKEIKMGMGRVDEKQLDNGGTFLLDKEEELGETHVDKNVEGKVLKEDKVEVEDTEKEKEIVNKEVDNIEPSSLIQKNGEETEVENKIHNEEQPLLDLDQEHESKEKFSHDVVKESQELSHNKKLNYNHPDIVLDGNNYEELLLNEDENMIPAENNLEINEEELLQDGDQNYDEMLTEKEMENVFSSDGVKEKETFLKDEKNAKKVIDDKLAAFFGHKSLKDGTSCTSVTFGTSTPNAKREMDWSSTPISKPLLQNTPFSNSAPYCTPAKTLLKNWKPSALRRSKLFASNTDLNRAGLDNTHDKCSTILEDNEEEVDDDGDDFDTSLMKLEQKLAEIENNQETSPSDLSKTFSKIEAYHKTIVAERKEDCQKLEEVMTELSSQLFSDVQKVLSQGSQAESTIIGEDEEEDITMQEFLEGGTDGLMVVEDIDFANEQNNTVIEMKDEACKQNEDNGEDMLRLTCSHLLGLNASGATLRADIDKSGTTSNSDFAKSEPTVIEAKNKASFLDASTKDNEEDVLRLTCSEISGLNASGATLSSDNVDSGTASNSNVKLEPTPESNVAESTLNVESGGKLKLDVESTSSGVSTSSSLSVESTSSDVSTRSSLSVESTSSGVSTWSTLSETSSNATMSGSPSSDVSCSSLSEDSVELVLDTSLNSDNVKYWPIPVVVLERISSSGIKELAASNVVTTTSEDPEPESTSSIEPEPKSSSSEDPEPEATSSLNVVATSSPNVVATSSLPVVVLEHISSSCIKELAASNVVTTTSEDPEPESTSSIEPEPKSTSSVDPLPKSTSSSDVVKSETLNTLSTKADVKKEVASEVFPTNSSRIDHAQELKPYSDLSLQRDYYAGPDDDEFYSDDPLENLDNFNPDWAIWRNLTNDRDRYREIAKRWRNMSIPNPNVNLTFLKCLEDAKERASHHGANQPSSFDGNMNKKKGKKGKKKRKFREAFEPTNQFGSPGDEPPAKRQKCTIATEIFDNEINKLLRTFEGKRYALQTEVTGELNQLAVRQEQEMFDCIFKYNGNHQELQFLQIQEVGRLTDHFQNKLLEAEQETSDVVCMLRMSIEEVKTFHAFYEDLQDDNGESQFITKNQLDELLETEFIVSTYKQRYGE